MRTSIPRKIAVITGLILAIENISWAEPVALPGPTMPDTVSRALKSQEQNPEPEVLPPVVSAPEPAATPGGEEAKKIKFQLNGIVLEGNHIFTDKQLEPLYAAKIKKVISVADLFAIVQEITNFYRNNGYIISRAILPPQHVKGGVVKIQVIEGYIDKVTVTGDPKTSRCIILGIGEQIAKCRPLQIHQMEKYLLIANEVPGVQVRAVLSPSENKQGAADLNLDTQLKRYAGYFSYDNYGTRYIGPQQMTANVAFNSFGRSGDVGQFTMTKTPKGGELTFMDANYTLPIDDDGTRFGFGATRAQTRPLFVLQPVHIDGLNWNYYANLSYPVIRERARSLTLLGNFGYLDSYVTTFDQELYSDHIRSLGGAVQYNFSDSYLGANSMYFDMRQGLPILGYTSNTNPQTALTSRPGGRADYTKFDTQLSRLQAIKGPVSLYGVFRAQYAFSPLLASEQFTFGGSQLGRGYDVAELIGDKGIAASAELRYDLSIGKILQGIQFYTFYDYGEIWNYLFIAGSPRKVSGTSTGFGARFFFTKYISGNFMWTQTLTKPVAAEQLIGDGRRPRMFFSIVAMI